MLTLHLPYAVEEARELQNDQPVHFESSAGRTLFQKHLAAGEIWVIGVHGQ
jgi:hypothetical protein